MFNREMANINMHFVITGLETGGAEMMLFKLLSRIDRGVFVPEVTSLMNRGAIGEKLVEIGIPVHSLGMSRGKADMTKIAQLIRSMRLKRPDIVQTWMYHADLIGGLAAKFSGQAPVVWNIRNGNLDQQESKRGTFMTVKACSYLSRILPERIVCCAESAKKIHAELGYKEEQMTVIPNGFDVSAFKPDVEARQRIRTECGIPERATVIGLAGRFDPQKDHAGFFAAAAKIRPCPDTVRFVLCGNGIDEDNQVLHRMIKSAGLSDCVHLLGVRGDMAHVTAVFDIGCSSSAYGEAFSNTIGEAMACGAPCVVTDIGDSSFIVGETGETVPPRDAEALSGAMQKLIKMDVTQRRLLGARARERIVSLYSIEQVVSQYENMYFNIYDAIKRPAARA